MIKYYKELEKPRDFTLPLVKNDYFATKIEIPRRDLPQSFIDKYNHLLRTIKEIDFLIRSISIEKLYEKVKNTRHVDEQGEFDFGAYTGDYQTISELEEIKYDMPEEGKVLETPTEIIPLLEFYNKALSLVIYLCPEIKSKWEDILKLFSDALKEIENHRTFKHKGLGNTPRNVKFPNAWYITCFGDLYNTGNGHKETNLYYPWTNRITRPILAGESIEGAKEFFLRERSEILKNGFVCDFQFREYFNYRYDFPCIQHQIIDGYKHDVAYESRIVKAVLGVVSAEAGLYSFFEDMQKYTNKPKKELKKLIRITRDQMSDILVRCARFYKIESMLNKTITTSSLTPFADLHEYIKRGWDVCYIPPIIINREKGVICELDIKSPIVERYIEGDLEKYEKAKEKGYGKIY